MVSNKPKYEKLHSDVYTIRENTEGERSVSRGKKWEKFTNIDGLAAINDYINWHHRDIDTQET